jgi:myo-inositol catabolism protein IolS
VRQLQQAGKIRVIGQSAYGYQVFLRVCPVTRPEGLQFGYSALGSGFDRPESNLFRWAEAQNLGMVLFGPLAQGILLDKFDPEHPPQFGEGDIRGGDRAFTRECLLEMRARLQPLKERLGSTVDDLVRAAL